MAQVNIVPNPSFEETSGRVKGEGAVELAAPWKSMTLIAVDLYSASAKSDEYSVPKNVYGEEDPKTGSNYVGLPFYGYGSREPRAYLGVELTQSLEAGKEYCMKFHVSMSDMSKFAVNNLGIHVSKEDVTDQTDGVLSLTPHIKSMKNDPFSKQFLWTPICGLYKAEGGEKFITIGNFDSDEQTATEKIRLSREFAGKRQQNNGYYFVDDVSVIEVNEKTKEDCLCDKIAGGKMKVEFKSFGTDDNKKAEAKKTYIVNSDGSRASADQTTSSPAASVSTPFSTDDSPITFKAKSADFTDQGMSAINDWVKYLKDNKDKKIAIVGHVDGSESTVDLLGKKRAFYVRKKLRELGIDDARMTHSSAKATIPSADNTPQTNARVTIEVK